MKRLLGPLVIENARRQDGQDFYAVVERPVRQFYLGTRRIPGSRIPPRRERWHIKARTRQEATKTLQYHFYASPRWRLLPEPSRD